MNAMKEEKEEDEQREQNSYSTSFNLFAASLKLACRVAAFCLVLF